MQGHFEIQILNRGKCLKIFKHSNNTGVNLSDKSRMTGRCYKIQMEDISWRDLCWNDVSQTGHLVGLIARHTAVTGALYNIMLWIWSRRPCWRMQSFITRSKYRLPQHLSSSISACHIIQTSPAIMTNTYRIRYALSIHPSIYLSTHPSHLGVSISISTRTRSPPAHVLLSSETIYACTFELEPWYSLGIDPT